MSAPDPREGRQTGTPEQKSEGLGQDPPTRPMPVIRGPVGDPAAPILEQRLHLLEMSSVFWELGDGPLRALARRMNDMPVPAGRTLQLKLEGEDAVMFLAAGTCELTITNKDGKVLLVRRSLRGDQLVLPPPSVRDDFVVNIQALTDSSFATLDRVSLERGLGVDFSPLATSLDKLWEQEVAAFESGTPTESTQLTGQVVAFCSAKGGSGATTLTVNTAAALAAHKPDHVVLLDLATPYGHAALYADLIATGSMVTASKAGSDAFGSALRAVTLRHRSGLSVLPGSLRPEETDLLTGDLTSHALTELCTRFELVIVDLGTSLQEAALAVIERARRLVLVLPPEIAALSDARRALGVFTDLLQMPQHRIDLVLNQRVPKPPLDRAAVESILGRQMTVSIGYDGSKPEAASLAGGLVLQRDAGSAMARGAAELAELLAAKIGFDPGGSG